MRLTELKLAGFKSFVDATTLHLHGQRIGIVGPNGCGKSNVMEAIRWVLGESSARELRGDSMQDVIFNGSQQRKAISRASVELRFDNSLGSVSGAGGIWSQYAEIAVKRVMERDTGSSYFINNTVVRRKDVTELFLGTGVGSRAYAIIGQNTISRLVDARPEEVRGFLEEAAGISRYKERRRETESRLQDSKDNLARLQDIRGELSAQISRLDMQAEMARRYHFLHAQREEANKVLWLLKKRQASTAWEKAQFQVTEQVTALDAHIARLRAAENQVEQHRIKYQQAVDQLQQFQAGFYQASAELSSAEQQIKFAQENKQRSETRKNALVAEIERLQNQLSLAQDQILQEEHTLKIVEQQRQQLQLTLAELTGSLPLLENHQQAADQALRTSHAEITQAEHTLKLLQNEIEHQERQMVQLNQRYERLQKERQDMVLIEESLIAHKQMQETELKKTITEIETKLQDLQASELEMQNASQQLHIELQSSVKTISHTEAQIATLEKIQVALTGSGKMSDWLNENKLNINNRLWQSIKVDYGWELALESVLEDRLNALMLPAIESITGLLPPPETLWTYLPSISLVASAFNNEESSSLKNVKLISLIQVKDSRSLGWLSECLAGIFIAEDITTAMQQRHLLMANECLVCRDGCLISAQSIKLYSPGKILNGVLERQEELNQLKDALPSLKEVVVLQQGQISMINKQLANTRATLMEQRNRLRLDVSSLGSLSLEVQKLQQQNQNQQFRLQQISHDAEEITHELNHLRDLLQSNITLKSSQVVNLPHLRQLHDATQQKYDAAIKATKDLQHQRHQQEKMIQEINFKIEILSKTISSLRVSINVLNEDLSRAHLQLSDATNEINTLDIGSLEESLMVATERHRIAEDAMIGSRQVMSSLDAALRETDQQRTLCEQQIHPLRDRLERSRLHEQECRLAFEQCLAELDGADIAHLEQLIQNRNRVSEWAALIDQLTSEVGELGAVNLAAIEQLKKEKEREQYLESQLQDLNAAIDTLEEAIRRIDKETRGRLSETFNTVNLYFSELFDTLFKGGNARLEMQGDEILDSGIQIYAQPPGKKNSTIQLLSGGEKALTALALVFALFRLNPAPFCLMDEVDAPLDDSNTERFCRMVRAMSEKTQFVFISHNKIAMEMAQQLIGVTMQESGVSRIVEVDVDAAMRMTETA